MSVLRQARSFAVRRHGNQRYGPDDPYEVHLRAVESVLREFGVEDEADLAAAWLHDVVEDTTTTLSELEARFGPVVRELVDFVTDQSGKTRKERKRATYARLRGHTRALRLKLADRIANMRASITKSDERLLRMYTDEAPQLTALRSQRDGLASLWDCHDALTREARHLLSAGNRLL